MTEVRNVQRNNAYIAISGQPLIHYQPTMLHSLSKAAGQEGLLQLFVRFSDETEPPEISWFEIGDVVLPVQTMHGRHERCRARSVLRGVAGALRGAVVRTARFLSPGNPHSVVKLKEMQTGEETAVAFKSRSD
jgi:hypothetical protein